jgi:hypothetical protein
MLVNASVMKSLEVSVQSMIIEAVTRCSQEYSFDLSEALNMLELSTLKVVVKEKVVKEKVVKEKTKKVVSKKIPLPFIEVNADRCYCLLKNYGLYTQCENLPNQNEEYCLKCEKKDKKFNVCDRDELIMIKKIKITPYLKIMEKLNLTRDEVETEAAAKNVSLTDNCFDEVTMDKKETTRGRPKKEEPIVELENDNILELVESNLFDEKSEVTNSEVKKSEVKKSKVKKPKVEKPKVKKSVEDDEESIHLSKFKFENVKYYKDNKNGFIYDFKTTPKLLANNEEINHIGIWNENENRIDMIIWDDSSVDGNSEGEEEEYD